MPRHLPSNAKVDPIVRLIRAAPRQSYREVELAANTHRRCNISMGSSRATISSQASDHSPFERHFSDSDALGRPKRSLQRMRFVWLRHGTWRVLSCSDASPEDAIVYLTVLRPMPRPVSRGYLPCRPLAVRTFRRGRSVMNDYQTFAVQQVRLQPTEQYKTAAVTFDLSWGPWLATIRGIL